MSGTDLPAEVARRVREHFASVAFNRHLGMEIAALGRGTCEVRLPWRATWGQQHGFFHGGVIGSLADTSAGHATLAAGDGTGRLLTVEYKLNFLAPARGEALVARARVLKAGRTLVISQVDVAAVAGAEETACAAALVTYLTPREA